MWDPLLFASDAPADAALAPATHPPENARRGRRGQGHRTDDRVVFAVLKPYGFTVVAVYLARELTFI